MPSEWLPNRKEVTWKKVKEMDFSREDFGQKGKIKRPLVSSPRKLYDPLMDTTTKTISLVEIAKALEEIAPLSIIHQAVPTPEIDFVREIVTKKSMVPDDLVSVDDVLPLSDTETSFFENLQRNFNEESITRIENMTRGQSSNDAWYNFRKSVITDSKCHKVLTKVKKLKNGDVNISTFAFALGNSFTSPDLPALKYGRAM
ncbi:MAG: hypothetical protein AAFY76_15930, partial [Cyanobacteria bacterium J06649_11]